MVIATRKESDDIARRLSLLSDDAWLVVDTSLDIGRSELRVWRERTIHERRPDCFYELVSRAVNGQLERIA